MKKILIIRFSSIGDIVLTTPVIRCLKTQMPDAEIHYFTKKQFLPLLQANPYLKKIHLLEKGNSQVFNDLKEENFDLVIDLHKNLRTMKTKLMLRKRSISFNKLNVRKWLAVKLKLKVLPDVHVVDRYMETVKALGIENDGAGLDYFIPPAERTLPPEIDRFTSTPFVAFAIGGQHNTKRLPDERIAQIVSMLRLPVILLGGKEDAGNAEKIIALASKEQVVNACGALTLNQSAQVVSQAASVITHDTGLMHIASAFRRPVISVWGNTVPEFGMYPYSAGKGSAVFEVKGLGCRPCSKLGYSKCPLGHFKCMNGHDVRAIAEAANG